MSDQHPENAPLRSRLWNALNHQVVAGIIILVLGLLIGSLREPAANLFASDTEVRLDRPPAGADIPWRPVVAGTVDDLPAGHAIWILNRRRLPGARYFVADGPCDLDGSRWTCDGGGAVFVGLERDEGADFMLRAVAIGPDLQRRFIAYLRDDRSVPDQLPDVPDSADVPVTREQAMR